MQRSVMSFLLLLCAAPVFAQAKPEPQPTAAAAAATPVAGAQILHVPLNEALEGDAKLELAVVNPELAGKLLVHVRAAADGSKAITLEALHGNLAYEAIVPADKVVRPSFAYWITEHMPDGSERPVFASEAEPHRVRVSRTAEAELEHEHLEQRAGQRSTVLAAAEVIDYGNRRLAGQSLHDRYYRLEAGYGYAFLSSTVDEVRLSLVRVRGQAASFSDFDKTTATQVSPGIDYGRAEVRIFGSDFVRLRGVILLGASQRGFEYGGGGGMTLGDPNDMNVALDVERITTLGTTASVRLGFLALPRLPMGTTVEVSSFPVGDDAGVRLLYDIGYRFGPITTLTLRAGYQGRTSVTGGPSLGLHFEYGF